MRNTFLFHDNNKNNYLTSLKAVELGSSTSMNGIISNEQITGHTFFATMTLNKRYHRRKSIRALHVHGVNKNNGLHVDSKYFTC